MEFSEKDLTEARDTVQSLLEQLGLSTYLFEVEPRAGHWEVRIECAPNSAWRSSVLEVEEQGLAACRTDQAVRERMLREWRRHLKA